MHMKINFPEADVPIGWEALIDKLEIEVTDYVQSHSQQIDVFTIIQIKEKFGELRVYYAIKCKDEKIKSDLDKIILNYEKTSCHICAFCGKCDPELKPENFKGWLTPVCEDCKQKY